jgi:Protein of unknown function (DUF4038)/Putative collagen-binding domain of a collagenase
MSKPIYLWICLVLIAPSAISQLPDPRAISQPAANPGPPPTAQIPPLRVSDNHHSLVTRDGKPFFWLGDTGWELFHKLTTRESEAYFSKRAAQGFTVIQAVALAELDGLHTPNTNGDLPLLHDDPLQPNEAYFRHMDTVIDLAANYHLYIGLLPTWGDKVFKDSWGKGPEIFNPDNAYAYGKWIGKRYKDRTNIIWILGGDRDPRDSSPAIHDIAIWRSMAAGIEAGAGGAGHALITFHPQPKARGSSSLWFQDDDWLDINMLQTGHCRDTPVWETVNEDYNRTPAKPVFNGECIYEEMPVCFNPKELGYANAYDVRKAAYLSVFAGAFGHTYGCGPVIWFSTKKDNLFAAFHTWKEGLELPAANEMKYLRALIESRPMEDRIPDQTLLADQGSCTAERIQATRGKDYAFIYSAYGRPIVVNTEKIAGQKLNASWYDPRTGRTAYLDPFDNKGQHTFVPPLPLASPVPSQREDWVLMLDDAEKNYPAPALGAVEQSRL